MPWYNYVSTRYEMEEELHPNRVIVGSETYPQDIAENWKMIEKCPWVIGDFMWTAWDYLGEVGIGAWVAEKEDMSFAKPYPWKLADTGALDILGNDNAEAGLAATVWGAMEKPYIAVQPMNHPEKPWAKAIWRGSNGLLSWSWRGCEGNPAVVEVYTQASETELFINGASAGKKVTENRRASFEVPYQPGEVKAVAYFVDGTIKESFLRSAEGEVKIRIIPESDAERGKLLFVDISLCGENGVVECNADDRLTVTVEGGELLAFGSANPKTEEVYQSGIYTTYYGRGLAAILVLNPEQVTITVHGERYAQVKCIIPVK